ncbi:MAG: hypothetical protein E2O82_05620 [Betaproteobacteria bacterium]|nr:MAG: hypothetical protein E2O82_05620 [Betaproteobacteria bacterium]
MIEEHNAPDFIYTSGFLYAYPSVISDFPNGFLRSYDRSTIFRSSNKPFWLEKSESKALVNHSINFRVRFDYNMQFSLVSRKLINKMAKYGSFYQSPFPDYYASNAIMLKAERILIVPQPLVTIGISSRSFGFYYFNDLESKGNEFLKNVPDPKIALRLQQVILPGTNMNTSWLLSMETLSQNFCESKNLKINYDRYRFLQICAVYAGLVLGKNNAKSAVSGLRRGMTLREYVLYGVPFSILVVMSLIVPKRYHASIAMRISIAMDSHTRPAPPSRVEGSFNTILDVFEKINPVSYSVDQAKDI